MKSLQNKKGFTLIELIIVIAILGVLALVLVPQFMGYVDDADITAQRSNIDTIEKAATASLTKAKVHEDTTKRTTSTFNDYLKKSLGESFGTLGTEYKVELDNLTGTDGLNKDTVIKEITYLECVYTLSTKTYTGSCAD